MVSDTTIEGEPFMIHDIQPLNDQLLLVCKRSHPTKTQLNGRLYTKDGRFVGGIALGDGIETVQATASGILWTSYFDEGIFGRDNFPATSGLVGWSSTGELLYRFEPNNELKSIDDCYALNVAADDDVWFYYYSQFPLVHLREGRVVEQWQAPVAGSHALAISDGHVLFQGGYRTPDTWALCALTSEKRLSVKEEFTFVDESGAPIVAERSVGRGSTIHTFARDRIYRLEIGECIAAV